MSDDRLDGNRIVYYDATPKTVNKGGGGVRGHWSKASREKSRWEGLYMMLFLQCKLPKHLEFVRVGITLEFTTPNTRRDPENFRHPVVKPLADALVKGGYLPDDTADYFEVDHLVISKDKLTGLPPKSLVKSRITLAIDYRLARTAPEPSVLAAPAPGDAGSTGARRGRGTGDESRARRALGGHGIARGN